MRRGVLHSQTSELGFSLLEILIAITLLAFITLAVVNVTQNAFETQERTGEYNKNSLVIESALARFEWDFTQIYSPLYFSTPMNLAQQANPGTFDAGAAGGGGVDAGVQSGATGGQPPPTPIPPALQAYYEQMLGRFEQNERFVTLSKEGIPIPRFFAPEKNVFEFFTSSNRRKMENTPQSHFAWVRYGLADQETQPDEEKIHPEAPPGLKGLVRYFSADDPYNGKRIFGDDSGGVKGAILLSNVESLEFQFWDLKRRKWENNLRAIESGETIIRGVKVILVWWDSSGKRNIERIFRPHWPTAVPVDPAKTPAAQAAGAQAGAQGGTQAEGDEQNGEGE